MTSKTLDELEAFASMQPVERGRQGAWLTAAGEQFLRYVVGVTQILESTTATLTGLTGASVLVVYAGTLPTVASSLLSQAIAHLYAQCPHTNVRLRVSTSTELLIALKAGEPGLVIERMAEPDRMWGPSSELLYAEPLALVVQPGHPLLTLSGASTSLQAMLDYPSMITVSDTVPRHRTEALFRIHGPHPSTGVTKTLSVSVARLLVCRSDTVWITPEHATGDDLAHGQLVRLDAAMSGTKESAGLLRRSTVTPSELVSAFMELLTELAQASV